MNALHIILTVLASLAVVCIISAAVGALVDTSKEMDEFDEVNK